MGRPRSANRAGVMREFLAPRTMGRNGAPPERLSAVSVGKLMQPLVGNPVRIGDRIAALRRLAKGGEKRNDVCRFRVEWR